MLRAQGLGWLTTAAGEVVWCRSGGGMRTVEHRSSTVRSTVSSECSDENTYRTMEFWAVEPALIPVRCHSIAWKSLEGQD